MTWLHCYPIFQRMNKYFAMEISLAKASGPTVQSLTLSGMKTMACNNLTSTLFPHHLKSCITRAVIPGSSRYMIYADLHGSQCPVRTCLWKGCQSWAHNSAQGTPRCSKERWGQQEGAKRHTRSLKTQTSKYGHLDHLIFTPLKSQLVFQSSTWGMLSKSTELLLSPCSSQWLEWAQSAPCLGGASLAKQIEPPWNTDETLPVTWCQCQAAGHGEGLCFHGLHDSLFKVSTKAGASGMLKYA